MSEENINYRKNIGCEDLVNATEYNNRYNNENNTNNNHVNNFTDDGNYKELFPFANILGELISIGVSNTYANNNNTKCTRNNKHNNMIANNV